MGSPATSKSDASLHVGAIFIMFCCSTLGCLVPILSRRVPKLSLKPFVLEALTAFSYGIIIGTAFIHMISDGINDLQICAQYPALGLLIVLATLLFLQILETELKSVAINANTPSVSNEEEKVARTSDNQGPGATSCVMPGCAYRPSIFDDNKRKSSVSLLIFELGIVLHSVVIGVDLGVTSSQEFITLLIAICFHQFFEGIAVASAAVEITSCIKNLLAVTFCFAITTPVGIVIGILAKQTYSSDVTTTLWTEGVLNSIAGGILLYTGVVELLTCEITENSNFHQQKFEKRMLIYFSTCLGAAAMSILGIWA